MHQSSLLTLADAAQELGMTVNHLATCCAEGRVESILLGKIRYVPALEVSRIWEAQEAEKARLAVYAQRRTC